MEGYNGEQEEDPEIIEKAILIVKESKKGSTSLIQRKLQVGYARAAKILDILEEL
jgi:S-DNA-T family DNA segregation ATPase FtsK/SpoIIIE